jgi:uncharacterized DUF497 family protein
MAIIFDSAKSARNVVERGLPFELVAELEWDSAVVTLATRRDYGEPRFRVFGDLGGRLHAAVITPR